MRFATLMLLVMLPLAGCVSDDGTPEPETEIEEGTEEFTSEWTYDQRSGEFTTTAVLAASGVTEGPVTFPVSGDTVLLVVNTTISASAPDDVRLRFIPPDCDTLNDDCDTWVTTSNGEATFETEDPEGGEWSVHFFGDQAGNQGTYEMEIGQFHQTPVDGNVTAEG